MIDRAREFYRSLRADVEPVAVPMRQGQGRLLVLALPRSGRPLMKEPCPACATHARCVVCGMNVRPCEALPSNDCTRRIRPSAARAVHADLEPVHNESPTHAGTGSIRTVLVTKVMIVAFARKTEWQYKNPAGEGNQRTVRSSRHEEDSLPSELVFTLVTLLELDAGFKRMNVRA